MLYVMLIWAGFAGHGGPATITGFESADACERARPYVTSIWPGNHKDLETKCVALILK